MGINLSEQTLPTKYSRLGKECFLDPFRQKLIYITPEEIVRQQVLSYLVANLNVPKNMILVEEHLSHFGVKSKRRADIVILGELPDETQRAVAIVECKAPGVYIGQKEINQMLDYCDALGADYGMVLNDETAIACVYNETSNTYETIETLPTYESMLSGKYTLVERENIPERIAFEDIASFVDTNISENSTDISPQTLRNLAYVSFNLVECLLDVSHKMPTGEYHGFRLIEDYGVRMLSYGNAGGGTFSGPYRSFLIERNGSTEFVSMTLSTFARSETPETIKTALIVAIDDEKTAHHSLQLCIDDNVTMTGNTVHFNHSGRIAVGHLGSGKVKELLNYVAGKEPELISENRFALGNIEYNRIWYLDDPEVMRLVENFIVYALLRDEYRKKLRTVRSNT